LNELGKEIKPIYKIATIEDVLKKSTLASWAN
jgi:type IV secretory pathway ATPase VirB11/archaellum biosynthesis ATPase